jgi:hypothetical protein
MNDWKWVECNSKDPVFETEKRAALEAYANPEYLKAGKKPAVYYCDIHKGWHAIPRKGRR